MYAEVNLPVIFMDRVQLHGCFLFRHAPGKLQVIGLLVKQSEHPGSPGIKYRRSGSQVPNYGIDHVDRSATGYVLARMNLVCENY